MIKINTQPIEKRDLGTGDLLDVHSIFFTIQGEGPFTGHRAIFIRLAGCNLQCPLCDTDYTSKRAILTPHQILNVVRELTPRCESAQKPLIVLTGGEPFRQQITPLITTLVEVGGYTVQIESNGTLPPPSAKLHGMIESDLDGVYLVVSPKTGKMNPDTEELACALKYVVKAGQVDPLTGLPTHALNHDASPCVARPRSDSWKQIYIQPADEQDEKLNAANLQAAVKSCLEFGHILQLQVHKLIGVE